MIDLTRFEKYIKLGEYTGLDILPNTPKEVIEILQKIDNSYFKQRKTHLFNNFRKEDESDEAYERAKIAHEEFIELCKKFKKNKKE